MQSVLHRDYKSDSYCTTPTTPPHSMRLITVILFLLPYLLLVEGQSPEDEESEEEYEDDEPPPFEGPPLQSMCNLTAFYGYKCEEHIVTTKDNYILQLYRILPSKEPTGTVVLMVHGLFLSAEIYGLFNHSGGYQLADEGHDVWLPAMRGTVHGRNHKTLNPDTDGKFWDFSVYEMSLYDLPNQIEYILEKTKADEVHYVGHSLGTSIFFIMAAILPEISSKVKTATMMAPVFFFTKYQFMLKEGSSMYNMAIEMMKNFDEKEKWEAFPRSDVQKTDHQINCPDLPSMGVAYCNMGMDMSKQKVGDFLPAGTSKKNIEHLMQCGISGKATFFDYGEEKNEELYKQKTPPELDLKAIKNKFNVIYCESDYISPKQDVEALLKEISVESTLFIKDEEFNHMDFVFPTSEENQNNYDTIVQKLKNTYKK